MLTENLLSEQHANYVSNILLGANFPYYFGANIHNGNFTQDYDSSANATGFSHRFYDQNAQHSDGLNTVLPYLLALLDRNELKLDELLRVRAFLSLPNGSQHQGFPHIDITDLTGYKTAIVYVAGCDGETILYNEMFDGQLLPEVHNLTELCRVTPKPNSGIVFDGHRYHTGLLPQTSKVRLVLNFNFYASDYDSVTDTFVAPVNPEIAE
jgi:hypothetical protein